jgi:putative alpha-1,2-mannosidase
VFGALGLYPMVPGVGMLAIGSPLFGHASIALPHGRRLVIDAGGHTVEGRGKKRHEVDLAPSRAPYIAGLRIDGRPYARPWVGYCELAHGAKLDYSLGPRPDRRWGSSTAATPPSFGPGRRMPESPCAP